MNVRTAQYMTAAGLLLLLGGCERWQGGSTVAAPLRGLPDEGVIAAVPLGDVAGAAASTLASEFPNPYAGNAQAIQEGHELYIKMNCAGCHAYTGKGNMGPDLTDKYWRYRGVPVAIYKSIYEGRPRGMPAWGSALPPQDIWKLTAYIESLGGSFPADYYQHALQGDRPGEVVAPEVETEKETAAQSQNQPAAQPQKQPDAVADPYSLPRGDQPDEPTAAPVKPDRQPDSADGRPAPQAGPGEPIAPQPQKQPDGSKP